MATNIPATGYLNGKLFISTDGGVIRMLAFAVTLTVSSGNPRIRQLVIKFD
jgi:hypothetical protein